MKRNIVMAAVLSALLMLALIDGGIRPEPDGFTQFAQTKTSTKSSNKGTSGPNKGMPGKGSCPKGTTFDTRTKSCV
jgi:hypothetical protein